MPRAVNKSSWNALIEKYKAIVLDGGLATHLETKGHDLNHPLWSARLLFSNPEAIKESYTDFLNAGADCICTMTYQLSFQRCRVMGIQDKEVTRLLSLSVELAKSARDDFWIDNMDATRMKPLIVASIGPYGAYLADGSEYIGNYNLDDKELLEFHHRRWEELSKLDVDIMACETIPNFREIKVLGHLFSEFPSKPGYISLSIRNEAQLADGTPLAEVTSYINSLDKVLAIGVNCTDPSNIPGVLKVFAEFAPDKTKLVYPNSGEVYNADSKTWTGETYAEDFGSMAKEWYALGARWIGGCCRTGPGHINEIRRNLRD